MLSAITMHHSLINEWVMSHCTYHVLLVPPTRGEGTHEGVGMGPRQDHHGCCGAVHHSSHLGKIL